MRLDLTFLHRPKPHEFRAEYDRIMRRARWRTLAGYAVLAVLWPAAMVAILWWIG